MSAIVIEERGAVRVPLERFDLSGGDPLGALARALSPYVVVEGCGVGAISLRATGYVGEGIAGGVVVRVAPRYGAASLLEACLRYARAPRIEPGRCLGLVAGSDRAASLPGLLSLALVDELARWARRDARSARVSIARNERAASLRGAPRFERFGAQPPALGVATLWHEWSDRTPAHALIARAARIARSELVGGPAAARAEGVWRAWARFEPDRGALSPAASRVGVAAGLERAWSIAALLLGEGAGLEVSAREQGLAGWWVEVPRLFERAVGAELARWGAPRGLEVSEQERLPGAIADARGARYRDLRPDFVVRGACRAVAVLDAKYKPYWDADEATGAPRRAIEVGDLYQLSFYARYFPGAAACLIAPRFAGSAEIAPRYRTLRARGITIHLLGLDLGAPAWEAPLEALERP